MHALLPWSPACVSTAHKEQLTTVLRPSPEYVLRVPLKRPGVHAVHTFGDVSRLQYEPKAQPPTSLQSVNSGVGFGVGDCVGTGVD